jgi:HEAT repeat protein
MIRFLRYFQLDRTSFWLGFVAGSLAWWILGQLRPQLRRLWQVLKERSQQARQELQAGTEVHHRNDTIRLAQRWHLAAPLFSLDEILIQPRVMAPPPAVEPNLTPPVSDITELALPYLPDAPELASIYAAPTLSLAEAMQNGVNLILFGHPGSGKTVALAHLAVMVARHDAKVGNLRELVPFLIHAADLILPPRDPENPLTSLSDVIINHASALTLPRLTTFIQTSFESGRALLLLDGMDELSQAGFQQVVDYLATLLGEYPLTHIVTTASPSYFGGLTALDFVPIAIAAWNKDQRAAFIKQWGRLWTRFVAPTAREDPEAIEPLDAAILNGWLLTDTQPATPIELTLKVWATYAGDLLGPDNTDGIEAYINRLVVGVPNARLALERLAWQMLFSMQPVVARKDAQGWISEYEAPIDSSEQVATEDLEEISIAETTPEVTAPEEAQSNDKAATAEPIINTRVLTNLVENGLLTVSLGDRLKFAHPVIAGYLASHPLATQVITQQSQSEVENLLTQPEWTNNTLSLHYLASQDFSGHWITGVTDDSDDDPLKRSLFKVARWLRDAPEKAAWRAGIMRQLAECLQDENLGWSLRGRALAALVNSNTPGTDTLFRKLLTSSHSQVRQLSALGCGALLDNKAFKELNSMLVDRVPDVRRAACLALVTIGNKDSLEALAEALLTGDEDLRRFTAEALANHREEGHPTLQEGSKLQDLMVRRAVVFGLMRVKEPWSFETLGKMQVEDDQWVVQNAATQALEDMQMPDPRIPKPLPALTETPWLIAFAGEKGIGVVPGKPAMDLLLKALQEGSEEQKLAALHYLSLHGDSSSILPVYQVYFSSHNEVNNAALDTLWHHAAAGIELPSPVQFGLA